MTPEQFKIEILPWSVKLYPLANRMLKSDSEAQDAVQEIMMKLWDKRKKLLKIENLGAYIVTLSRNHCLDMLKKKKAFPDSEEVENKLIQRYQKADDMDGREKLEFVHQLIEEMPEKYREVIQYREIDGLDFEEIRELTGYEIPHIRVLLSRARLKLKEEIRKIYDYEQKEHQSIAR